MSEEFLKVPEPREPLSNRQVDTIRGLDICITTSARNDEAGKALLEEFNFPLRQS